MNTYGLPKHKQVELWVKQRETPFDTEDAAKAVKCSYSTALDAIRRHFPKLPYTVIHVGSGNFRNTWFPLTWEPAQMREWLNARTKSGKSTATIYGVPAEFNPHIKSEKKS